MEFLGKLEQNKDITTREYVAEYVESEGGKINRICVDGVEQPIVGERKTVNIILTGKTDKNIEGQNGTSVVNNFTTGGKLQFTHTDGTVSTIGVNDGGNNGISAQISAVREGNGVRLNVENNAIYYIKGADRAVTAEDEIVTAGNIPHPYFSAVKKETAEEGYFATYYIADKDGEKCGTYINIPKDFLVKKAELKTCVIDDVPVEGYKVGDKYIDFVVNAKEGEVPASESHIYLLVKELVDIYKGGNGITINESNIVSAKVVAANGLSVDASGIKMAIASADANGAMTSSDFSKLGGITPNATKTLASTTNGNVNINDAEVRVYTHPVYSEATSAAIKVGRDNLGHVEIGEALKLSDLIDDESHRVVTDTEKATWNNKQDAIADLETIRSGAAKGATALQEHQDISGKLNVLPKVDDPTDPGFGWEYHIPYRFDVELDADKADITLHTLTLDNNVTKMTFDKQVPSASQTVAGLMSAADKTKLDSHVSATDVHITDAERTTWNAKQDAIPANTYDAYGSADAVQTNLNTHIADTIHVTAEEKTLWNAKNLTEADITVGVAIGSYEVGDVIAAGTSFETILRNMFTAK